MILGFNCFSLIKQINERLIKRLGETKMFRELKKQQGITLIALIVTIVVLLILARSKYISSSRR